MYFNQQSVFQICFEYLSKLHMAPRSADGLEQGQGVTGWLSRVVVPWGLHLQSRATILETVFSMPCKFARDSMFIFKSCVPLCLYAFYLIGNSYFCKGLSQRKVFRMLTDVLGAGELAHWDMCSLCKQESLGSYLQHPHKGQCGIMPITLSLVGKDLGSHWQPV